MKIEIITDNDTLLIRRMILAPEEATPWHTDPCHRFSVVVRGEQLTLEFSDDASVVVPIRAGLAGWDEPESRVHRAVNTGAGSFEEVVTFYRNHPGEDPQPSET